MPYFSLLVINICNIDNTKPSVTSIPHDITGHYNDTHMNSTLTAVFTVNFGDWIYEGLQSSDISINYGSCGSVLIGDLITTVTIGENVTSIENEAFINCSNLTTLVLPKNIISSNL